MTAAQGASAALDTAWAVPRGTPTMECDEVHVWRASLHVGRRRLLRLEESLSGDEKERACRYRFSRDRDRFMAARGILREILGRYLSVPPGRLRFYYGAQGKPNLAAVARESCGTRNDSNRSCGGLEFNVAHSGALALFALSRGKPVGVDLESIQFNMADWDVARTFFAPEEAAAIRALRPDLQAEAFFACWTRKEAYLKARGGGLSLPLDRFCVSLAPGEPAALRRTDGDGGGASWILHALDLGPGYAAAIAVGGSGWALRCWEY